MSSSIFDVEIKISLEMVCGANENGMLFDIIADNGIPRVITV